MQMTEEAGAAVADVPVACLPMHAITLLPSGKTFSSPAGESVLDAALRQGLCMLAPRVEARSVQDLKLRKTDKVLEIGTGSGFTAALTTASISSSEGQMSLRRISLPSTTVSTSFSMSKRTVPAMA